MPRASTGIADLISLSTTKSNSRNASAAVGRMSAGARLLGRGAGTDRFWLDLSLAIPAAAATFGGDLDGTYRDGRRFRLWEDHTRRRHSPILSPPYMTGLGVKKPFGRLDSHLTDR